MRCRWAVRRTEAWMVVLLFSGCGGARAPAAAPSAAASIHHPERAETHLFGLTEDAFPELAPLWPALAAQAATEVSERMRIEGEEAEHCLRIVVAGDLAHEARAAWARGAREAGYTCERSAPREVRCTRERAALVLSTDGAAENPDAASLEALASEMGVPAEPSSTLSACVGPVPAARLASVEARLHGAALLEPWSDLHERLGARRLGELSWARSAAGDEVVVRYGGDSEAFEQAALWARERGLAGDEETFRRIEVPLSVALDLNEEPPEIVLTLEREP